MGTANPTIRLGSDYPAAPGGFVNAVFQSAPSPSNPGQVDVTCYVPESSAGPEFEADGDSLTGWVQDYFPDGAPVTAAQATSGYSPFDFSDTFNAGNDSDINQLLGFSVAGSVIEFDIVSAPGGTAGQPTLAFGCSAAGAAGPAFILGTTTNKAGIGSANGSFQNSYITPGTGPIGLIAGTWYHIKLVISKAGTAVTWYLNGVVQQQVAITIAGDYLAISGGGYPGGGNFANLRIYQG
jgi:hypothetical protein